METAVARVARSSSLREIVRMEDEWGRRVEEAKWRYVFAKAHLDELLQNPYGDNSNTRIHTARQITAEFKREYARVLHAFSELVMGGIPPRIRWR
jgi:hypothetical protein